MALIETKRLRLVPFDMRLLLAARAEDRMALARFLECNIAPGWPSEGVLNHQVPAQIAALKAGTELRWLGRLIVLNSPRTLVGVINLKGAPDEEGRVEIGYEVVRAHRRQGIAGEAATALINWCWKQDVKAVRARTLKHAEASREMLKKLGFARLGPQRDPVLGEMVVWEITPSSPSG
jgi:ribosomal-protein-alanine N-acetyltransferase